MAKTALEREKLPDLLRPFFWDYRFSALSWENDRDLVIGRVLAAGSWEAIQWLRKQLGDDELRRWLEQRRGAGLSPRQLRFWELVLDLPHRRVSAWIADAGRQVWDARTIR